MIPMSSQLSLARAALPVRLQPLAWAAACLWAVSPAVLAQTADATQPLSDTVVTATRTAQPLSDLVADVSVVDREALDRSGAAALEDVLARLPGVELVRNGGLGTTTSIYLRGANNEFTAVYIDGIRVDAQSGSGGAPWEAMPLDLVERIEVLRGPAGAVYGSDAIGGVVQIFTHKGEGPPRATASIGAGSHGTYQATAGLSGGTGAWDYSLGLSQAESDGFNSRTTATANPDKDGYRRRSVHARLGWQLQADHRLDATLVHSETHSGYDSSPTADDRSLNELQALGLSWQARWSAVHSSKLSVSESRNTYETRPSPYQTDTVLRNYLFHHAWQFTPGQQVTAALERREDELTNTGISGTTRDRSQNALALGYQLRQGAHSLQLHARHDRDSEFGGKSTGSAAYGYAFAPQWRITASVGTAFRAPTLYQRFSLYGDDSLRPQESRNAEVGLRWAQGDDFVSATAYRNRVRNLINWTSGTGSCAGNSGPYGGCYANVARASYEGLTLAGAYRMGAVRLRGSVDFQDPRDDASGLLLARRAKRHAVLGADTALAGWTLGAEAQVSSWRFDNVANTKRLGGYTLFNLSASKPLGRDLRLYARLDNLADKAYQLADTYATAGRTFYVGLKWAPQ